jgi:hypothetical protein
MCTLRIKSCVFGTFAHDQNSTNPQAQRFSLRLGRRNALQGFAPVSQRNRPRGAKMPNLITVATTDHDPAVEKRLWQAVVVSTIQEWISGPLRYKRIAEEYLFQDRSDFPLVCQSAGLDVDRLRQQLTRLRTQSNPIG